MDVSFLDVGLLLHAIPDLQSSALVICAVGARDKLLVLSLEGEPGLKVELGILLAGSSHEQCLVPYPTFFAAALFRAPETMATTR